MTGFKSKVYLFIAQGRIKTRKLINRLPGRFRVFGAPLLGGLVGLLGGIPGLLIGLLLGYLLGELFVQSGQDRKILGYLENPGVQQFYEGEGGLAAWCALGVLVASAGMEAPPKEGGKIPQESSLPKSVLQKVILGASCAFGGPGADPVLMEYFSRLAWQLKESLNPDLLAESLAARRAPLGIPGDGRNLGRALISLAGGEKAASLAREIGIVLDPSLKNEPLKDEADENYAPYADGKLRKDPWKVLGLAPGTPPKEVKAHFRRLAKQFHPDEFAMLEEKYRETAARAFVAIQEAYKEVSERRSTENTDY